MVNEPYLLIPHKESYFLPLSYNDNPNHEPYEDIEQLSEYSERGEYTRHLESEFQISFMTLTNKNIFGTNFNTFLAYTHRSYWQLYNEDWSRPFRETNYNPEVFARYVFDDPLEFLGFKFMVYDIGLEHESNGQIQELSRSWNRVFGRAAILTGTTFLSLKVWYRLPEKESLDDNPRIYQYKGYASLTAKTFVNSSMVQLTLYPGTKYAGGELTYSAHWKNSIHFYTKISYGYGISLQDFDNETRRIGIGISLGDFFQASLKNQTPRNQNEL